MGLAGPSLALPAQRIPGMDCRPTSLEAVLYSPGGYMCVCVCVCVYTGDRAVVKQLKINMDTVSSLFNYPFDSYKIPVKYVTYISHTLTQTRSARTHTHTHVLLFSPCACTASATGICARAMPCEGAASMCVPTSHVCVYVCAQEAGHSRQLHSRLLQRSVIRPFPPGCARLEGSVGARSVME